MDKIIYVDHSATTYVKKEVLEEMLPYFTEKFAAEGIDSQYTLYEIDNISALEQIRSSLSVWRERRL